MKKFVAIMLILAIAVSGLLFVSCKKEQKRVEKEKAPVEEKKTVLEQLEKIKVEKKKAEEKELEEKKKAEEKKVEEKALMQEEEWKKFRNNESKYLGSVVTWEVEVWNVGTYSILGARFSYVDGWLGGHSSRGVKIILYPVHFDDEGLSYDKHPELHDDDWIIVTGSFKGVDNSGYVMLEPIAVINKGVK